MAATVVKKQALSAKKAAVKGVNGKKQLKVRTSASFHRPKTLKLARKPKYPRKAVAHYSRADDYSIILAPITTETAVKELESSNTLVFQVDIKANKYQIKQAMKNLYNVDAAKINTLIRPNGTKKAFIRLTPDQDAMEVASKAGFI
ncbi:hypothetical protein CANCADRAFT_26434 [Tortispora caseinolytica NRRL Y-17796]|uniref:Large ribosomal subunit protein uL23 n=1 Tax=Tortispora caseinolytica NRRL Y-17796 TaxID=767744 RepID=A0A1E4TET4_9ASCO|nr:hypothetical protein CANCADRAFT_26434 [Tortispora caseinolytica NRRL Y-17796]